MTKIFNYLTIGLIGTYIVFLYFIKRLNFLIHERYLVFTLIAGIILIIVGLVGFVKTLLSNNPKRLKFDLSLVIFILTLLIFLIPLRTLSSDSFDIRSSNKSVRVSDTEKTDIRQKIKFNINTNEFSMYDWVKAKGLDDLSIFKDKEFTGTGFISPKQGNTFALSRFILSCCVVDATPVGLLVEYDYMNTYKADDWLEVKGKFIVKEVNGFKEPVIIPTSITKINQPDDVYLNRK